MKTDYKFGDKVKVLTKRDGSTEYRNGVVDGIVGFVISDDGSDKFLFEAAGLEIQFAKDKKSLVLSQAGQKFDFNKE